jgi:hypothetical protein
MLFSDTILTLPSWLHSVPRFVFGAVLVLLVRSFRSQFHRCFHFTFRTFSLPLSLSLSLSLLGLVPSAKFSQMAKTMRLIGFLSRRISIIQKYGSPDLSIGLKHVAQNVKDT